MADAPTDLVRFPVRAVFPEGSPQVCVTFFTCAGTGISGAADLQYAYPAAVTFLDAQRNTRGAATLPLRYELVWLDNGSEEGMQEAFIRRGAQFERVLRNPTNQGLFRAVNDVRPHPSPPDTPRLVLARHTCLLQVWFREGLLVGIKLSGDGIENSIRPDFGEKSPTKGGIRGTYFDIRF